MLIDELAHVLGTSEALSTFWGKLDAGKDSQLGAGLSVRPLLIAARFAAKPQSTLVVIAGDDAALTTQRALASYVGEEKVVPYPERLDTPFAPKPANKSVVARRMRAQWALLSQEKVIVVASASSLVRMIAPCASAVCAPLVLKPGLDLSDMPAVSQARSLVHFEDVLRVLERMGYENTGSLNGPGTFCVRGGIIDVYPGNTVYPVRLDFFGDELDEIRRIVPSTGQTIAEQASIEIYPVVEYEVTQENLARARANLAVPAKTNPALRTLYEKVEEGLVFEGAEALLPYLYDKPETLGDYAGKNSLVCLTEPKSLFDDATHYYEEMEGRARGSHLPLEGLYAKPQQLGFGRGQRAVFATVLTVGSTNDADLSTKRVDAAGSSDRLMARLNSLLDTGYTVVFSLPNGQIRHEMELSLVDNHLPIHECLDFASYAPEDGGVWLSQKVVNITDVDIPLGILIPQAKLALISLLDVNGSAARTRVRRKTNVNETTFPYKPGDYVVHAVHGVAHFAEIVRMEVDGVERDYLLLEYAEGDKLYVPVEQLDRVTRYVGPEGSTPRLTRLSTADWERALNKARKATKALAFDLVDVYSRRAASVGYKFPADTPAQLEMEAAFPYRETADQLAAIEDVKADMQSAKPMDRLICGDVGFGKTEVALRAAFKAAQCGKQVMVLCPTTILAQQHYINFKERFEPFGVAVEVLSRFRTPAQQQAALDGFAEGTIPVLVGTHRLLSRDVNPHDLGLVIIDEEQRFGVGHKEQFKNLRESVDVLTLSATPIPRTLQMSLSGVRDMSLILTPPGNRRPVQVHVGEWDPDVVSDAIRRELARGGQVYYVSNRVNSIEEACARVAAAAGEARIGVAHGKLAKDKLEEVMENFAAGELDVLVATTIIESGIDNPHTNTLIIEDSQRLGLAQMYQLKGRVGRSSRQAYAYFMFPAGLALTEDAAARLNALDEHQDLGSGLRIALRDLEIRGAGSLLGAEQSGNMSAVGFDLFAQMLAQAVTAAREGSGSVKGLPPALSDIVVNIPGATYLPEDYIPATDERVAWYRAFADCAYVADVEGLKIELAQKHPDMPEQARNLLWKTRIRALANEHGIKTVVHAAGKIQIEPIEVSPQALKDLRVYAARYLAEKKKFVMPTRYFEYKGKDINLFEEVYELLRLLLGLAD